MRTVTISMLIDSMFITFTLSEFERKIVRSQWKPEKMQQ
jgi:hypothetical protein